MALHKIAEDAYKAKVRMQLYKNELDQQVELHAGKQAWQRVEDKEMERQMLEYQRRRDMEKARGEQQKRAEARKQLEENVEESAEERRRAEEKRREERRIEQERHRESILQM